MAHPQPPERAAAPPPIASPPPGGGAAPTRRAVLVGTGVVAAAALTAACSSSSSSSSAAASPSGGGGGGAAATVPVSDVPVGGGTVLKDQKVVVAQPAAGTFTAFSAVCPHQGCLVGSVADGTITCPCHGSEFSATDGAVKKGPATSPLSPAQVTVSGSTLTVS